MKTARLYPILLLTLSLFLSACGTVGSESTSAVEPLPPAEYLENALQFLQTHAIKARDVDWAAVRKEISEKFPDPQTSADTHLALCLALRSFKDSYSFLHDPEFNVPEYYDSGYYTAYPDAKVVYFVTPDGPADKAGLQMGDIIEDINGEPPEPENLDYNGYVCDPPDPTNPVDDLTVLRDGQKVQITLNNVKGSINDEYFPPPVGKRFKAGTGDLGYIELTYENGVHTSYPTQVNGLIKSADMPPVCGWMIDLRRNHGGDIWSYTAALGPLLGEGDLGGFEYLDGRRESWVYRNGEVLWNDDFRPESIIDGQIYQPKRQTPVALLIGPNTFFSGELVVVAFQGRGDVRTFGEPTQGAPTVQGVAELSDGVMLVVSPAIAYDRTGKTYEGAITPDVPSITDWAKFGTEADPVIQAASSWLRSLPACQP
jgi:C-terminal processing protease CtpA/Prc